MRWLINAENPTDIKINIIQSNNLQRIYNDLISQFQGLDLPLLRKKIDIAIKVIDFVLASDKTTDPERLRNASTIMRALIASPDPDMDWLYKVDIAETREQKFIITDLAIRIKNYNKTKKKEENKEVTSLEKKTSRLSNILGFYIDIKKTSVLQYLAFQDEAHEKVKTESQWQKASA